MKVKELIERLKELPQDDDIKMEDLTNKEKGCIDIEGAGPYKNGIIIVGFH